MVGEMHTKRYESWILNFPISLTKILQHLFWITIYSFLSKSLGFFFCTTKKRSDSSWNAFLKPAAQILYILTTCWKTFNESFCMYVQLLNSLLTGLLNYLGLYPCDIPSHSGSSYLDDTLENILKSDLAI